MSRQFTLRELQQRLHEDVCYQRQFGADPEVVSAKKALVSRVLEAFLRSFPSDPARPVAVCFVPGRVEILGKHTDYAGGHSLLAAVDRGFFCISASNGSGRVRLAENDARFGACEFPFSAELQPAVGHWSNYPMTMTKRLASNFGAGPSRSLAGVDAAFGSDLPVAGGLSGSSALMIMTFFALALPNQLMARECFQQRIRSRLDLAMYLACAENGQTFGDLKGAAGVGTFGGSEDHTQILNATTGALSLYEFCPTRHLQDVEFPKDLALVIAHSGVEAQKTGAAMHLYNRAAQRARQVVTRYNEYHGTRHQYLRDILHEHGADQAKVWRQVEASLEGIADGVDLLSRFAQFHEEEQECIPNATRALAARDHAVLGEAIDRSHRLSRTHLQNIIPEIDLLQASARELGAVAASGFGAGFGGSAYAIIPRSLELEFAQLWRAAYLRHFPAREAACQFFQVSTSGRAGELFD